MKIEADWLKNGDLQHLMHGIQAQGYSCFAVGGCVRNTLMGRPISDVDLASDALPKTVTNIAKSLGFRAIPTGIAHGTVTVICGQTPYEITTFRADLATDGRHATVQFSTSMAEDAARRDFTMNAIYAAPDGQIYDPTDGLPDVKARRLRFVGAAQDRIAEDFLRILRYFRFSAVYADPDLGFDSDILAAVAGNLDGLDRLSKERIGQEMRKLLGADDPAPALGAMVQTGVLARVLPGANAGLIAPLVHIAGGANWLARLAALGGKDARESLRLSRKEVADLDILRHEMAGVGSAAALAWQYGAEMAGDILALRAAALGATLPPNWRADALRGAAATCPVTAADFMPRLSGPDLGRALARATKTWLDSDLTAQKADLI